MINFITVKTQAQGHLVNGTLHIPADPDNHDHVELLAWLDAGNVADPEFTADEIAEAEAIATYDANLAFLARTDHKDLPHYERNSEVSDYQFDRLMLRRRDARRAIREYRRARR